MVGMSIGRGEREVSRVGECRGKCDDLQTRPMRLAVTLVGEASSSVSKTFAKMT